MRKDHKAGIGGMIEAAGVNLRIGGISASRNTAGKFGHCVAEATLWAYP
jgi:hypothetical protein